MAENDIVGFMIYGRLNRAITVAVNGCVAPQWCKPAKLCIPCGLAKVNRNGERSVL